MNAQDSSSRRRAQWNRLSLALMVVGIAALIGAGVLVLLTLNGSIGKEGNSVPKTITGVGGLDYVLTPQPTPTTQPPPPSAAAIGRFVVPRFGIDAPVVVLGVDGSGVMQAPSGPEDVAWYDFSGDPGRGPAWQADGEPCCNGVFSGHVDYINYGAAVFYDIGKLDQGDGIEVRLNDGTVYTYRVVTKNQVYVTEANVQEIVGDTPNEVITLITCGGSFDSNTGQYDQRVIVRAERVYDASGGVPAASTGG